MHVVNKKTLLPFQNGLLLSITALKGLYEYLKDHHAVKYLLTAQLNQDCLENFFTQLRGLGHHYDHPSPVEAKNRFRLLLLARNSVDLQSSNVQSESVFALDSPVITEY